MLFGGFSTYADYLASRHWRILRAYFCRPAANCYACGNWTKPLDLHHTSYERLGRENVYDIVPVCRNCHERIHERLALSFPTHSLERQVALTSAVWDNLFGRSLDESRRLYGHYLRWHQYQQAPKQPKNRPARQFRKKRRRPKRRT